MRVKVLKPGITLDNSVVDVNAVIDVPEKDGVRLEKAGYVKAIKSKSEDRMLKAGEDMRG